MPEPTYSLAQLARSWAKVSGEPWKSILYRLGDWAITDALPDDVFLTDVATGTTFHKTVIFDRLRWHRELSEKIRGAERDPEEKARLQQFAERHIQVAEIAVLRRDVVVEACRAMNVDPPPILGLVEGVSAEHRVPPECPFHLPVGVFAREAERDQELLRRRDVMPADEAEEYTLLWDAAAEMSRNNGHGLNRNWLRLMDAFWRGELASAGLVHFYRGAEPGRELGIHDREALAGLLLGWRQLGDGTQEPAQPIENLRHWTVEDYLNQPAPFGDYFRPDPEGRLGLAVLTGEFDCWRERPARIVVAPTAIATEPREPNDGDAALIPNRRGPESKKKTGAVAKMIEEVRSRRLKVARLLSMKQKELELLYPDAKRTTLVEARKEAVKILRQNSGKTPTNDK